jgi:hypothetical protein
MLPALLVASAIVWFVVVMASPFAKPDARD